MNALWILALLILVSGIFSLAEMALASARRVRLTQLAEAGDNGAATALAIKEHPSRLLAASQTGITPAEWPAAHRRDEGQTGYLSRAAGIHGQLSHRGRLRTGLAGPYSAQGGMFYLAEWEFEVVDVDRNRVDQVLASRVTQKDTSAISAVPEKR